MIVVQRIARKLRLALIFSSLLLLLAACNLGGSNGGSGNATPTAKPSPTPTQMTTLTPTAVANLTTYTGNGYTIGYPQGWTVNKTSAGAVTFSDPQGVAYLTIQVVPNPGGAIATSDQVNVGLQLFASQAKNYNKVSIAPTTSLAGDTWSQGAATGDITLKGQTSPVTAKFVVIADNHPANSQTTQSFTIAYATGQQIFDMANTTYFQPMLQSFKFS